MNLEIRYDTLITNFNFVIFCCVPQHRITEKQENGFIKNSSKAQTPTRNSSSLSLSHFEIRDLTGYRLINNDSCFKTTIREANNQLVNSAKNHENTNA